MLGVFFIINYKKWLKLTLTFSGQNLIILFIRYIDNIACGSYGKNILSAVAIVGTLNYIVRVVISSFSESLIIFLVQKENFYLSKNNLKQAFKSYSLYCSSFFAVIISLILFFYARTVISYFVLDESVILYGTKYLKITCFSYIFLAFNSISLAILEVLGACKQILIINLCSLITHVGAVILIKQHINYSQTGQLDKALIAIATINFLMFAFETIIFGITFFINLRKTKDDKPQNIKKMTFCEKNFSNYILLTLPLIGSQVLKGVFISVRGYISGRMGVNFIAANSITVTFSQILGVTAAGTALATLVTHNENFKRDNAALTKENIQKFQAIYWINGFINAGLVFVSQYFIPIFYNIDTAVKDIVKQTMTISAIVTLIMSYQLPAINGIIKGYRETKWIFLLDILLAFGFVAPFSLLSFKLFNNHYPWLVFLCLKIDHPIRMILAYKKLRNGITSSANNFELS